MSKASGVVLILAGLATAAYVLPSGDISDPEFGQLTDVAKSPPPAGGASRVLIVPEPKPAVRPAQAAAEPVPSFATAPVVVTIAQRPSEQAAPKAAPLPRDREGIGRELQKELKRVGCYEGELNGAWTATTRQAMKAFTDRVNASLPTDEPDSILLTMVRGYQDRVCGKACPAGQGLGDGGRCMPNAILVRAAPKPGAPVVIAAPAPVPAQKPVPAITGWSTTTTAAAPTPPPATGLAPPEGRMALAGPAAETPPVPGAPLPGVAPPAPAPEKRVSRPAGGFKSEGNWARNIFKNNWN